MARVTFQMFPGVYNGNLDLDAGSMSGTKTKATYADITSGDKLILEGRGFRYDEGNLVDGTVHKFSIVDANGKKYEVLDGFELDSSLFSADDFIDHFEDVFAKVFENDIRFLGTRFDDSVGGWKGNDILFGRGGDDILIGGLGKDALIGGAGADTFVFGEGYGRDRIKDFDANGADGSQDLIQAAFADVDAITRSGRNTVIDFGGGDVLTLVNVRPNAIDQTDFI